MKKYENFCQALDNLSDIFKCAEPYSNIELTGMVGLYEICFEQSWKAMKEILTDSGFSAGETGSPRQVLKTAFAAGMIDDEHMWLSALQARNNVTHAYDQGVAREIVRMTKENYYAMFLNLKENIEANWSRA